MIAVGFDPTEGPEVIRAYQAENGYPWTFALGDRELMERYKVLHTAFKYAVNGKGIITMHKGYGTNDAKFWDSVFQDVMKT